MKLSKGRLDTAKKVVIYGPEGIGKSTFASRFPNPIFIDTEGSTQALDVIRVDPAPASFAELMLCVSEFIAHPDALGTLVIDTADWTEKLCWESVCAQRKMESIEDAGCGKGYTYIEEEFGKLLNQLKVLVEKGVHVCVTAHAQMRKFEQPDELGAYDRWELKMGKKTSALLKEWADMLLFANYKTMVVNVDNQGAAKGKNKAQGGARVMYTTHHPCWDAKNRYGLPDELPFDFDAISHVVGPVSERPINPVAPASSAGRPAPDVDAASWDANAAQPATPPADGLSDANARAVAGWAEGVPAALLQLMERDAVNEEELRRAVAAAGFYPEETPVSQYDKQFVLGVLVADWGNVRATVDRQRGGDVPF